MRGRFSRVINRSGAAGLGGLVSEDELSKVQRRIEEISGEARLAKESRRLNAAGAVTLFEKDLVDDNVQEKENAVAQSPSASVPPEDDNLDQPQQQSDEERLILTPVRGPWLKGLGWRGGTGALLELVFYIGDSSDVLGSDVEASLCFEEPSCLTALPDGEICVVDSKSHHLLIITPEGQPRAMLSGGEGKQRFRHPRGIACDETSLYISEVGSSRIRKMRLPEEFRRSNAETPRGAHMGSLSLTSTEAVEGQLTFPQGICLDRGELFVADCEDHRIVVYNAYGIATEPHAR